MHTKKQTIRKIIIIVLFVLVCGALYAMLRTDGRDKKDTLSDGEYEVTVQLEGGSGRASVASPTVVSVTNGQITARLQWSSTHYDYMLVDGEKYYPINETGNACFEVPVKSLDAPMEMIADTTAMSKPHEIVYQLTFSLCEENGDASVESNQIFQTHIDSQEQDKESSVERYEAPQQLGDNLVWTEHLELNYATEFSVDYYQLTQPGTEENTTLPLITINGDLQFLVLPENMDKNSVILSEIPEGILLTNIPHKVYLVASPVMDMMASLEALDSLRFTARVKDDWSQESVRKKMEHKDILYAGKYSAPDYELLIDQSCDFVIENTMIYHTPEVREKIESFGIPVIVDRSSYERSPLGRMEWIKLYGILVGRKEQAEKIFDAQCEICQNVINQGRNLTDTPTVVFFYLSPNGEVKVRRSNDYLPKMIEMAGGTYIFHNLEGEGDHSSTVTLQMEEFYATAKDADYIIYNSTIVGELDCLSDLLEKNPLFQDMKAVKEQHVYCTEEDLYQSPMSLGEIIEDIYHMFTGEKEMKYLYQLR